MKFHCIIFIIELYFILFYYKFIHLFYYIIKIFNYYVLKLITINLVRFHINTYQLYFNIMLLFYQYNVMTKKLMIYLVHLIEFKSITLFNSYLIIILINIYKFLHLSIFCFIEFILKNN